MNLLQPDQSLKTFMDDTVITVFDAMLAMTIEPSVCEASFPTSEIQFIGMVGLAGGVTAVVCLRVPESFSGQLTRAMLGMEPTEPLTESDITDVIGELANIIAGKLKSCFHTTNGPTNLSLPTIVHGHHIDLESIRGTERHSYTFHHDQNLVVVEFYSLNQNENTP